MLNVTHEVIDNALAANKVMTPTFKTRRATFALNKKRLTRNLKKDAQIENFHTVYNNFDENVNIKCSSGFFLNVIGPGFLELAKQASDPANPLVIDGLKLQCNNERASLDNCNLLVNMIYNFTVSDPANSSILGSVRVHVHVTTKLVQLQGAKVIRGTKAPVWFHQNVLKDTLKREAEKRKAEIDNTNREVLEIDSSPCKNCNKTVNSEKDKAFQCISCSKIYHKKCTNQKSLRSRTQPKDWKCSSCDTPSTNSRKRRIGIDEGSLSPPPSKVLAVGISTPTSTPLSMSSASSNATEIIEVESSRSPGLASFAQSRSENNFLVSQPSGSITSSIHAPDYASVSMSIPSTNSPVTIQPALTLQPHISSSLLNVDAHPYLPVPAPLSVVTSTAVTFTSTSASSVSSLCSTSSAVRAPALSSLIPPVTSVKVTPAKRTSKSTKTKPTLATDPQEFEKENLRIERDTCRLKLTENDNKIKDLKEQLDIYIARCSLLEKKRNDDAYDKLTKTTDPVHLPSQGPCKVLEHVNPPKILSSPSSSALESLVNLEVLKVVKANTDATNSPSKEVANFQAELLHLETRLNSKFDQLKTDMNNLFINKCIQCSNSVSSRTETPPSSSEVSRTVSATPTPFLFSFPPPPIKETKTCSSQTDPIPPTRNNVTRRPTPTQIGRKSILGSPPPPPTQSVRAPRPLFTSVLGKPPLEPRKIGTIPCLSSEFIRVHGRTTSENIKNVKMKKKKPTNQKQKTKPHVKTAVLVDFNKETDKVNIVPTHSILNIQNSRRRPEILSSHDLIDLDSPEVSNQFGDPLSEDTSYCNLLDNLNW